MSSQDTVEDANILKVLDSCIERSYNTHFIPTQSHYEEDNDGLQRRTERVNKVK